MTIALSVGPLNPCAPGYAPSLGRRSDPSRSVSRILVSLSTTPRRRESAELATMHLRDVPEVSIQIHHAPRADMDPGPIWKWVAPMRVDSADRVLVCDDDIEYGSDLVDVFPVPGQVWQAFGYAIRIRDNPIANGGPFLDARFDLSCSQRTDIFQAFAGILMTGKDFIRLRQALRRGIQRFWPSSRSIERISDDYVVSRAAARLGLTAYALPRQHPPQLPASGDEGALWRIEPGHVARYTQLLRNEQDPLWWHRS